MNRQDAKVAKKDWEPPRRQERQEDFLYKTSWRLGGSNRFYLATLASWRFNLAFLGILCVLAVQAAVAAPDVPQLYQQHCAECHGPARLGAMGPALLPDNLGA